MLLAKFLPQLFGFTLVSEVLIMDLLISMEDVIIWIFLL